MYCVLMGLLRTHADSQILITLICTVDWKMCYSVIHALLRFLSFFLSICILLCVFCLFVDKTYRVHWERGGSSFPKLWDRPMSEPGAGPVSPAGTRRGRRTPSGRRRARCTGSESSGPLDCAPWGPTPDQTLCTSEARSAQFQTSRSAHWTPWTCNIFFLNLFYEKVKIRSLPHRYGINGETVPEDNWSHRRECHC